MTTVHLRCPFVPCEAEWWVGMIPGQTWYDIPNHMPEGDFPGKQWYDLRCPGAITRIRKDGPDAHGELSGPDRERIERAYEYYLMRLASENEQADREEDASPGKSGMLLGFNLGRPPNLTQHGREMYFPGRPADAPEPGPDEPRPPVPAHVEGHRMTGRESDMTDSHEHTAGLTSLAIEQHKQALGVLGRVREALNSAEGVAVAAEHQIRSAQSLVIAAVGTGAGKPAPAEQLAEQTALAVDTVAGAEGDNLFNAIRVAKIRVEAATQQVGAAITQGEQYLGILAGGGGA